MKRAFVCVVLVALLLPGCGGHSREAGVEQRVTELNRAVHKAYQAGRYKEATGFLERLLALQRQRYPEERYPDGHPDVALCLNNLGFFLELQGKYELARDFHEHALTMYRRLYPKKKYPQGHPDLAMSLHNLGGALRSAGEYEQTREYFERASAMYQRLYPQGHPELAKSLSCLGDVLGRLGDYELGRVHLEHALELRRRLYPREDYPNGHPDLAENLCGLACMERKQDNYEQAQKYCKESVEMYGRLFPRHTRSNGHPDFARSLQEMGATLCEQGEYVRSRGCYEAALEMFERLFPEEAYPLGHPALAIALDYLGHVSALQGDFERAKEYIRQALAMKKRLYPKQTYPQGHPGLAASLASLGSVLAKQGEYEGAKERFEQAALMYGQLYPQGHPNLAVGLCSIAFALESQGEYRRSLGYHEQALAMRRRLYPAEVYTKGHPDLAASYYGIGILFARQGEHERGQQWLEQALAMNERLYPQDSCPQGHPRLVMNLKALGSVLQIQGQYVQARNRYEQAARMEHELAILFFAGASEAEALNFAAAEIGAADYLLSMREQTKTSASDLYSYVWMRRCLVQRVIAGRQRAIQQLSMGRLQEAYDQYLSARRFVARLMLAPADPIPERAGERAARLRELSQRKERLERQLAASMPEFRQQLDEHRRPYTNLIGRMPKATVFIDIFRYSYSESDLNAPRKPRYIAFLLQSKQPVVCVELGPVEPLDEAVEAWREDIALFRPSSAAAKLRQLLWELIERCLPDSVNTVYFCPDGPLTRVPWAALPGGKQGTVLLDDYAVAVVPHGPFLLDELTSKPTIEEGKGVLLAVGDVDYDGKPADPQSTYLVSRSAATGSQRIHWPGLPASKDELHELERAAGSRGVCRLTGSEANSSRILSELPRARWAHFATHGFFADPKIRSALQVDERAFERHQFFSTGERTTVVGRNPLVLSGLVLAGANLPRSKNELGLSESDGGILTAEAIAGLPLHDLELAVLSACDTGLGEVAGGEGVFGLQRAFHIAGAHNVIASLWKVDDQPTAALMRLFYHKLWVEKKPPIVALRESQLALYRNPAEITDLATTRGPNFAKVVERVAIARHPASAKTAPTKVWAAFVLSGAGR